MKTQSIRRILIVGGTHGNELTGSFLVKKWRQHPELLHCNNVKIDVMLANPDAIDANRRYLDKDLNRCFSEAVLNSDSNEREVLLAKQLVEKLGKGEHCAYDLIIDLHTSTANMNVNLVLTQTDAFHLAMAEFVKAQRHDVFITSEQDYIEDQHFLCAIAPKNILVEVGPVPQGVLHHESIEKTESSVLQILSFVDLWNSLNNVKELPMYNKNIDIYCYTGQVGLPVNDTGEICGFVHRSIQGKDYSVLKNGDAMFYTWDDKTINYQGKDCYISFINEAAYYDKKLAFCTLEKTSKVIH